MSRRQTERATIDPAALDAVIFDLDGVVTRTARVHAAAWKEMFDRFLEQRAEQRGERFVPFDAEAEYRRHVDGKPRYEGVRDLLAAREIALPWGDPGDPPQRDTICGLGNRKNELFRRRLRRDGVEVYRSTVELLDQLEAAKIKTAVVTSSKNGAAVLEAAGLAHRFPVRIDGNTLEREELQGKPAPDMFLEAARRLGVSPSRAAVVEDAEAGVEAGRRGGFGLVVGVARSGDEDLGRYADVVVDDLSRLQLSSRGKEAP